MAVNKTRLSLAKIEVEQHFCNTCSWCIKRELQRIDDIKNIRLYPKQSLITFNFFNAHKLSDALNVLSKIGYNEKGENSTNSQFLSTICSC